MLGIVVVVVSASVGAALATGPRAPSDIIPIDYVATWNDASNIRTEAGSNDQVVRFDIPEHNITYVMVRLSWEDDEIVSPFGMRADELTLRVEGPSTLDEEPQTVSGTTGELIVEFTNRVTPSDPDVENMDTYDDTNATGEWSVTVSVLAQGLRDTGNDWTVSFTYEYYTGRMIESPEET